MPIYILIGRFIEPENGVEVTNLYTGSSGEAMEKAAHDAAKTEKFSFIGKMVNPQMITMPVVDHVIKRSTPVFPKSKSTEVKLENPKLPETEKREAFNPSSLLKSEGLRSDGPTFEQFVAGGGNPESYPPAGYVGKESEGWALFRKNKQSAESAGTKQSADPKPGKSKK